MRAASALDQPTAPASETCPVTLPNGGHPPSQPAIGSNHGNGRMWTALWPFGVVIAYPAYVRANGAIGMKFPWWTRTRGSRIAIVARRLDAGAPAVRLGGRPSYPTRDERGTRFWASGIVVPTQGCWKITARVGGASLTVVQLFVKTRR